MSKSTSKILPNQVLWTKGYSGLPDGTQVMVTTTYSGGEIVSVITGAKQFHFINIHQLMDSKPVAATTVPNWVKPLGTTVLTTNHAIYIFGHPELKDNTIVYPADGYIHNEKLDDLRCVRKSVTPWEFMVIEKKYMYVIPYNTNSITYHKKPLAKDEPNLSDDHKYMIELLKEPNRDDVINMVMRGVDLTKYEVFKDKKYFVIVPKEPETLYMPMIMAHTDIQRNVKHPTDDNLQYDKTLDKFTSPTGLGADDRAGCYAINRILNKHPGKFIVALFDEEEIGCVGSGAFGDSIHFPKVNRMASCYISIDRKRGYNGLAQIATYGHDNKKLFGLIETATGRKTVVGSSTDCATLSRKSFALPTSPGQTKLACFNMSCGYENEHQHTEALYFKELQQVVDDFDGIVDLAYDLWEEPFESSYIAPKTTTIYGNNKKSKRNQNYNDTLWGGSDIADEITIDGETYDEADLRILLYFYRQENGKAYKFADANNTTKEFEVNNYVRLDKKCALGGTYAGLTLTKDLYDVLISHTWVVTKVKSDKLTCDILSEDGTKQGSNIPYAVLSLVLVGDPIIETTGE